MGGGGVETAGVPSYGGGWGWRQLESLAMGVGWGWRQLESLAPRGGGRWRQLESLAQTPGTCHPTDACRTVFSNHDHATG